MKYLENLDPRYIAPVSVPVPGPITFASGSNFAPTTENVSFSSFAQQKQPTPAFESMFNQHQPIQSATSFFSTSNLTNANTSTDTKSQAQSFSEKKPFFCISPTYHPMHNFVCVIHDELPEKCTTSYQCSKCGIKDESIYILNKITGLWVQAKFQTWVGCTN